MSDALPLDEIFTKSGERRISELTLAEADDGTLFVGSSDLDARDVCLQVDVEAGTVEEVPADDITEIDLERVVDAAQSGGYIHD